MFDLLPPLFALLSQRPGPYIAMMLAGFAIGVAGHLFKVKWLVGAGVILIFLGALLFPLAANLSSDDRPPPIEESRTGDTG